MIYILTKQVQLNEIFMNNCMKMPTKAGRIQIVYVQEKYTVFIYSVLIIFFCDAVPYAPTNPNLYIYHFHAYLLDGMRNVRKIIALMGKSAAKHLGYNACTRNNCFEFITLSLSL